MYSVIRFGNVGDEGRVKNVANFITKNLSSFPLGFHSNSQGFSCSLSQSSSWIDHQSRIEKFLVEIQLLFGKKLFKEFDLEIDLALYPEDYEGRNLTSWFFDSNLIKQLAVAGVSLEISLYGL